MPSLTAGSRPVSSLLIANRGEVAVRIIAAARERGFRTVALYSDDDAAALHVRRADDARPLAGIGPRAYMDAARIIAIARDAGCDAVHPGYGLLSERPGFARACIDAGITFVGPRPEVLEALGDKACARALAVEAGVPVLPGSDAAVSLDDARAFLAALDGAPMVVKAIAGGGGRGMRVVRSAGELAEAYERCRSEAQAAFGSGDVYVERYLPHARHIEVQALGDRHGGITHVWERDCSLQRRYQKLVEVAPAPGLDASLRARLLDAATTLARRVGLDNLATFEFLVDTAHSAFFFIEANPRLQVEHPVTEAVTGVDLVQAQLGLAAGATLAELGLDDAQRPPARGYAVEARISAETLGEDGIIRPATGVIAGFEPPAGAGVRVDTAAYTGWRVGVAFDPLLAKLVAHDATYERALIRAARALAEFRIDGVDTNVPLLRALLDDGLRDPSHLHTTFVEEHLPALLARAARFATAAPARHEHTQQASRRGLSARDDAATTTRAGTKVDATDPLAVLEYGKSGASERPRDDLDLDALVDGRIVVRAPLQGTVIELRVATGDEVRAGAALAIMEAMKMEHVVAAPAAGVVARVAVAVGDAVYEGAPLVYLDATEAEGEHLAAEEQPDLDRIRPDLAEAIERHAVGLDERRPQAVERRRKTGHRTARENIADLVDPGSFIEYGPLVIAAQRRRRTLEDLIANTPADGLVAGVGTVNAGLFGPDAARCIAMSYDYTVLAGTQGGQNHRKKDRMFELAEEQRLPVVLFAEGGGGRPGDTDGVGVAGLDCLAFWDWGRLSGLVPLVAVVSGRCFAGNAALAGCADVLIATKDANIGMGGPAMVEGGGLGVFRPEDIGPASVQAPDGVIDVLVEDEAEAVAVAKRYLAYFQGALPTWECADQRLLRAAIPENRRRVYDVRRIIDTLADSGSVLELRRYWGLGMITALARIEGRPVGVIANNPMHLAGAIDSDAADKAARFLQLCDAFDLPVVSLLDTPGIMVGPEAEKTALVRHASRLFVTGANLTVPLFAVILRKAYGLGAQAMAGGSFRAPFFTIAWPTGEFGGMGLEGAVKLGYRNELAAIQDPAERKKAFDEMVARMYAHGKAVNTASTFEIDDVIDPMDTRRWLATGLRSAAPPRARHGKKRPNIDTW